MISKMASNTTGEGSGSESTGSGRRLPLSLNGSNGDENTIKEVEVKKKQTEAPAKKKEVPETKMEEGSQKSHNSKSIPASPSQNKESETVPSTSAGSLTPQEDVDMETLQVDASPIRSVHGNMNALPAATSTPGRSLFSFRGSSKQTTEVDLTYQTSGSPAGTPARTFAQITGRRPINSLTPSKVGTYRSGNSDLDTSSCTNASMNATVGSETPNSSSFSFLFFGRGRKRDRTPPPLSATRSTSNLGQDVELSPPKRARFDLYSLNLASPFSMLRSKFSKTTISSPARLRLDLNGSGVEEQQGHTSSSSVSEEVEVEEEQPIEDVSGLETTKEASSTSKEIPATKNAEGNNVDGQDVDEASDGENIPPVVEDDDVAGDEDKSRCSIM